MKSMWSAILMGMVLFLYGYLLSSVGHDHASHQRRNQGHDEVEMSHVSINHSHD